MRNTQYIAIRLPEGCRARFVMRRSAPDGSVVAKIVSVRECAQAMGIPLGEINTVLAAIFDGMVSDTVDITSWLIDRSAEIRHKKR